MSESFAQLFESSLSKIKLYPGVIVSGKVMSINNDYVVVNAGLKSESFVPVSQFKNEKNEIAVEVGDEVELAVEALEDGWGETKLSREKAKRHESWINLENKFEANEIINGLVTGRVKGGFTVEIDAVKAFLPGSLVDVRAIREPEKLEGQVLEFKIIKLDKKRNNIVLSRKAVLEVENTAEREALLETLADGKIVKGVVKNLTDYGAFVDLGGIDGLLHITDMAWKRVKHPGEIVEIGQELDVKILKFDKEQSRVSLGLKQLGDDPWLDIKTRYPEGAKLKGKVTNITDYGCFVEVEDGVEGLVHVSEMDWTNKNIHPSKVVKLGVEVEVQVLELNEDRRRISLGLKQCTENPWFTFSTTQKEGDKIKGSIKSITDFGMFIGLDGSIDGLIHSSDISWNESSEEVMRKFNKGDEVEAIILTIDVERERISLGIKQLESDPCSDYLNQNSKGSIVTGTVAEVKEDGATINLATDVNGYLKASEFSREKITNLAEHLKEGDSIEAKITGVDKKSRALMLSIKAKDMQEEKDALKEINKSSKTTSSPTLGDLLKDSMDS